MDLFYRFETNPLRGYGPPTPREVGQHLAAGASRVAFSMVEAIPFMKDEVVERFLSLFTAQSLWTMALVLAGWLVATVVGGLIGLAINAILILYGLHSLWGQLGEISTDLKTWLSTAYEAKDDGDLRQAGAAFAAALADGGLTFLELLVVHKVFKFADSSLKKRFPPPKSLEAEFEASKRRRTEALSKSKQAAERLKRTAELAKEAARNQGLVKGAEKVAEAFPTTEVLVAGGVVAIGAGIVLAVSSSGGK